MNKRVVLFLLLACLGFLDQGFALTPSRSYQWDFQYPNLVPNWSFENPMEFWKEMTGAMEVNARYKAAGTGAVSGKTGSFVGVVSGTSPTDAFYLNSENFRVQPSTAYTFSFYYRTNGSISSSIFPSVSWFSSTAPGGSGSFPGATLNTGSSWTLYTQTFSTPANVEYLSLSLARYPAAASGIIYFDDVIVEEGAWTSAEVAAHRQQIAQAVAYGDALGRTLETQIQIDPAGTRFLTQGTDFDDFARPNTSFLPTPKTLSAPAFQTNLSADAQAYYNNDASAFNAKGYPFSRIKYPSDLSPALESTSPDSAWQFGKGHTVKQDYYFVNDSMIPPNIENPSISDAVCKFRLDWTKNEDSTYVLTWTDKMGKLIRKATNITRSATYANTWSWAVTRYEYYPNGALKKVYTPLDESAGTSHFVEVTQSDAQGRVVSSTSPDRGLRKFWYTRSGQPRFSQDEEQRAAGEFTYMEYDALGRLIATGIQTGLGASPAESCVDQDACGLGNKIEQIGYIYDDTTTFQARTGFTLQAILGNIKSALNVPRLSQRLFCKYNRNADNTLASFSAKDRFVADFFNYDDAGNVTVAWKYTGPVRDSLKRLQDCAYSYDSRNRLTGFTHHVSATETALSSAQSYEYDFQGRVKAIKGMGGRDLISYTYAEWGPLAGLSLGGLPSGDSTTYLSYMYHSQGGLREIWAYSLHGFNLHFFYQQFLGYEGKAYAAGETPPLLQAKYDGSITQQLYKYATADAMKPVRLVNYAYDQLGRMERAKSYLNVNSGILNGSEKIIPAQLTMSSTEELSTAMEYDANGRILGQKSGGVSSADSARYSYAPNSYRLDHVTGKLTPSGLRNLAPSGTFTYDLNGAMLQDKSKRLSLSYGWDGLPVSFTVDSALTRGVIRCCVYDQDLTSMPYRNFYPSISLHNFYDADGNRVSRMESERRGSGRPLIYRGAHFVYMGPGLLKEWDETYNQAGRVKKSSALVSLLGQGSQIGRIRADGKYEFFVKNHLGSTVRTVDDRGRYNNGSEKAYDYLAYGTSKLLKTGADTTDVRQKFTGKELELLTGLYAFGARWHDPELGMWMSPDPMQQYFNPYSFTGGNPINRVDPDGLYACNDETDKECESWVDEDGATHVRPIGEPNPDFDPVAAAVVVAAVSAPLLYSAGNAIAEGIGSLFGGGGGNKKKKELPQNPQPAGGGTTTIYVPAPRADWDEARRNFYENFGTDPEAYDINRLGSAGEDWGALRNDPVFQYSRDLGIPVGRAVGEMVQIAMPMGPIAIPLRAARGAAVLAESRSAAFRLAKEAGGIPRSAQPFRTFAERLTDQSGNIMSRAYEFRQGNSVMTIREHSLGHLKGNLGPHFNLEIRPLGGGARQPLGRGGDGHFFFQY